MLVSNSPKINIINTTTYPETMKKPIVPEKSTISNDIFVKKSFDSASALDKIKEAMELTKRKFKRNTTSKTFVRVQKRGLFNIIPQREEKQFNAEDMLWLNGVNDKQWALGKKFRLLQRKNLKAESFFGILSWLKDKHLKELDKLGFLDNLNLPFEFYKRLSRFTQKDFSNFKTRKLKPNQLGIAIASLSDEEYIIAKKRNLFGNNNMKNLTKLTDKQYKTYKELSKADLSEYNLYAISKENNTWDKFFELKLLNLLKQKKLIFETAYLINYAFNTKHAKIIPEIKEDLKKMTEGKSVVPEFKEGTPLKKAFKKTKAGDAVQIGKKMYINDGETLYPWKMTRKKYDNLFPPAARYIIQQGSLGNCYFIGTLLSCMHNPYARAELYKSFEQKGDSIFCTVKAYKDFLGTAKYKDYIIFSGNNHLDGCFGMAILEQTYAKCTLREDYGISPKMQIEDIMGRLNESKSESDVMNELLGLKLIGSCDTNFNKGIIFSVNDIPDDAEKFAVTMENRYSKDEIQKLIKRLANDNRYILNLSTINNMQKNILNKEYNISPYHSYAVTGYDKKTDMLHVRNPHLGVAEYEIPFNVISKFITEFNFAQVKPVPKQDKNSIYNIKKEFYY